MEKNIGSVLLERYEIGRLLGQGSFAKVYYGRNLRSSESVAIKVIDKEKVIRIGLVDQIKREISVMRLVRHPNIVHLYEVMATKTKIYFVMEYARGGELFEKVAKGRLKEDIARKYFQQLMNAVDFCHSRGVYHRDLKPENLLLDENESLKVSDFGLSAVSESRHEDELLHTTCGTPAYVAPEVINRKGYNGAKADIWSCGVILYVLLAGYLPFHDSNLLEMYRKISKADFKCPNWFPSEAKKLVAKILDPNPATRISIVKIKENYWFRGKQHRTIRSNVLNTSDGSTSSSNSNNNGDTVERIGIMNAFDIISSFSEGFNLWRLFEDREVRNVREAKFTSTQSVSVIMSKLEEIGKCLKMKVGKKGRGLLRLDGVMEGKKGVLSIDAKIFELTPCFYLVEVNKFNGDTLEYQKFLKEDIRPALKDIVYAWQGEHVVGEEQDQQQ